MKIYCNRREKTLEDFVGKNVWVKVRKYSIDDSNRDRCGYVKILSNKDRAIRCYYISDEIMKASDHYKWMKKSVFKQTCKWSLDLLKLLYPLDILTDEEMKELLGI